MSYGPAKSALTGGILLGPCTNYAELFLYSTYSFYDVFPKVGATGEQSDCSDSRQALGRCPVARSAAEIEALFDLRRAVPRVMALRTVLALQLFRFASPSCVAEALKIVALGYFVNWIIVLVN